MWNITNDYFNIKFKKDWENKKLLSIVFLRLFYFYYYIIILFSYIIIFDKNYFLKTRYRLISVILIFSMFFSIIWTSISLKQSKFNLKWVKRKTFFSKLDNFKLKKLINSKFFSTTILRKFRFWIIKSASCIDPWFKNIGILYIYILISQNYIWIWFFI